jgi:hypothetical protein
MAEKIDWLMRNVPSIALPVALVLLPFVWVGAIVWALIEGAWQWHSSGLVWCSLTKEYVTPEQAESNYRWHYGLDDYAENPDDPDWDYEED